MPNINLTGSDGDLGNRYITKEYLMTVYPQIAGQLITPELWGWGLNTSYQLGDTTLTNKCTPVTTFAGGANWKQVAGASVGDRMAAIKTDGTLWIWASGANGDGANTANFFATPVTTFAGGTDWKQVSSGNMHIAAIKTDGTLWTWGFNAQGQLGNNTAINRSTPVTTFAGGTNWKQVAGGYYCTASIKTDGTLWTWGRNNYGQLGDNTTTDRSTPVTTFAGGTNWKQVACGGNTGGNSATVVAIKTDGTLWTWGRNNFGQLGDNTTTDRSTPVTTFAGGTNWKQVSAGTYHTSAIKTDGTLWTWGYNNYGQLGVPSSASRSIPVTTTAGGTNWKQVSCGGFHTASIKTDGTLWTWGRNSYGQLGDTTKTQRNDPITTFAGGTNWKQVSGGYQYTVAIKTSDDLQGI